MDNRLKKCKSCKSEFVPTKPLQKVCCFQCAFDLNKIAAKKKYNKEAKIEKAKMKERIKSLSDYRNDLQTEINKISRFIDLECPCIACNSSNGQMHGSHYRSVGGWTNLRFNLFNIYSGCSTCNLKKSGNIVKFRDGLISLFGQDLMNYIDDLNIQYPYIKLQVSDLKERIVIARKIVKELNQLNKVEKLPRSVEQRIELRKNYNKILNIYI